MSDQRRKTTLEAFQELREAMIDFADVLLEQRAMLWVFVIGLIVIEILGRVGVL